MLNFHCLILYLIIATGTILPIPVQGVVFSLHTAFAIIYFALLLQFPANRMALFRGIMVLLPIALVMLTSLARANDVPYALEKIEGAVLASLLSAIVTAHCVRRYGVNEFLVSYTNITLMILAATMVYRIALGYGIGSRDGRFLINGPITYGWLMGIAATIGLFLYQQTREKRYLIYLAVFFSMILNTGSKGPAVAFILVGTVFFIYNVRSKRVLSLALSVVLGIVVAAQFLTVESFGRFAALFRLIGGQIEEVDQGSIGVRSLSWSESISIFQSHTFFGVGLGNWEEYSSINILYPHNFFLEIASEMGLLGLAAFSTLVLMLLLNRTFFVVLYLTFFLLALSFSGDMSYYRYLLGIPLGLFLHKQSRIHRGVSE